MVGLVVLVVVLNGGSSSGKSSIARRLQELLGPTWLTLGVDDLVRALPGGHLPDSARLQESEAEGGIVFGADGTVSAGAAFRRAEEAWYAGLAAIGASGTGLIIDEVFLSGGDGQQRLAAALAGVPTAWVGVQCDPVVAEERERQRGDRIVGMARQQASQVHVGLNYDLVVDTTATTAQECAATIVRYLQAPVVRR